MNTLNPPNSQFRKSKIFQNLGVDPLITDSVRNQKQVLTSSDVSDIEGTFAVNLRGLKIENHF